MRKTLYRMVCLLALAACVCSLSSCGTIDSVIRYFLNLPANLFNAIAP